jgi:putative ABC transport system permease protein
MVKYIFMLLLPILTWAKDSPPEALLRSSDRARGGVSQGVTWNATLTSVEEGETSERKFTVKTKGDNALVEITSPSRNKGEKFLFNDTVMWFHKPSLRKPVSISPRQRNSGQAANGDIASIQYARDYTAKIIGKEKVNGEDTVVLELKAKSKSVTYDQIKYWISVKDSLGIKAEFLTLQGAPFKRAQFVYKNKIKSDGKEVPFISEMVIVDATFPENKSTLIYEAPTSATLSDSLFNVNNLSR